MSHECCYEWHIAPFLTCCYIVVRRILLRDGLQRVARLLRFERAATPRGVGPCPIGTFLWTVPRAQALLRGRAWVAQLWAKSVGSVRLRALPFSFGAAGVSPFRCEPLRAGCCCSGEGVLGVS